MNVSSLPSSVIVNGALAVGVVDKFQVWLNASFTSDSCPGCSVMITLIKSGSLVVYDASALRRAARALRPILPRKLQATVNLTVFFIARGADAPATVVTSAFTSSVERKVVAEYTSATIAWQITSPVVKPKEKDKDKDNAPAMAAGIIVAIFALCVGGAWFACCRKGDKPPLTSSGDHEKGLASPGGASSTGESDKDAFHVNPMKQ